MPLSVFIEMTLSAILTVWSPGPNNILLLSTASKYGISGNIRFMTGIWSGSLTLMCLSGLFCSTLGTVIPGIQPVMKYLGAASNDGYHNPKTDFRSYFLTFDDGARLELMHKPEMPDQPKELSRTGYAHIAFRVGSREKVDALTTELKADGYKVISAPRTTGDGYYESCIAAIEGNQIELTV